ncbi:MAG: DEAD/DEAH box helicase [Treponema sp.]|jgi:DNA excision repair protein ERCC-3|nr:DEAD/DEAH box helicase [Treponema sp.]
MGEQDKALIVQSDRTLLLDVHNEAAETARQAIISFAELEKSPEHIHTYRITPLSLWNAASAGLSADDVVSILKKYSRYEIPDGILEGFTQIISRYGKIRMIQDTDTQDKIFLIIEDRAISAEIGALKQLKKCLESEKNGFSLSLVNRGTVKRELIRAGWPVHDEAPLVKGEYLEVKMREKCLYGQILTIRDYQVEAANSVIGTRANDSGYGVVVLPCGSGKTIVGMLVMSILKTNTLILTTNVAAVHQWIYELLDKTELDQAQIAEYSGDSKSVAPVTVATYQIITWRPDKLSDFPHFKLFRERQWGLIVYDEVHLLPAPVFRVAAELQTVRRLGLTATLIREDGEEDAVFSLVGPKRYDVPWKELENKGWIAQALCTEIRVCLPDNLKIPYAVASSREKYRIASENPLKENIVIQLIENHRDDQIIVIGQYLSQLNSLAKLLNAPIITGKTANAEREHIYSIFKKGEVRVIVVSKVANFAIDLPDASMAVQVSGSFGSRQEEAQRLGRILRPKGRNAQFFTLISTYTSEEVFAANRRKFLTEQGYKYSFMQWTDLK